MARVAAQVLRACGEAVVTQFAHEHAIETFKSLVTLATDGLKTLVLINGGAVVALLAYLGQVHGDSDLAHRVAWPMILFATGLVAAGAAFVTAYMTQLHLYQESAHDAAQDAPERHVDWLRVTIVLAFLSIISFAVGAPLSVFALAG